MSYHLIAFSYFVLLGTAISLGAGTPLIQRVIKRNVSVDCMVGIVFIGGYTAMCYYFAYTIWAKYGNSIFIMESFF